MVVVVEVVVVVVVVAMVVVEVEFSCTCPYVKREPVRRNIVSQKARYIIIRRLCDFLVKDSRRRLLY